MDSSPLLHSTLRKLLTRMVHITSLLVISHFGDRLKYNKVSMHLSVSLVITGLGADFTKLESFGKVDAFAENLVR